MLADWLWAIVFATAVWIEVVGWTRLTGLVFPLKTFWPLRAALGFLVLAQTFFILSLSRFSGALFPHYFILGVGVVGFALELREPHIALQWNWLRSLSPLSWKRAWPWILLPSLWFAIRFVDALIPHPGRPSLSSFLPAAHAWFEYGRQQIEPLHPQWARASVWEALYYHIQALAHGFSKRSHINVLIQAQVASQLLHFTAGLCLTIALLTAVLRPWLQKTRTELARAISTLATASAIRHPIGLAPAIVWLVIVSVFSELKPTSAEHAFGVVLAQATAVVLFYQRRLFTAFFALASSIAIDGPLGLTSALGVLAVAAAALSTSPWLRKNLLRPQAARNMAFNALLGFALGIGPWLFRNITQTGRAFYPIGDSEKLGGPGWFPDSTETLFATTSLRETGITLALFWITIAITYAVLARVQLNKKVLHWPEQWLSLLFRVAPITFLALSLLTIRLPIHVFWQNLSYAFTSADRYLLTYHRNFDAKRWAAIHLPIQSKVVWTDDKQLYYTEQPSASIPEASILREGLRSASNPSHRAKLLCQLGFSVFAWEDRHHGSEVAGLASWLRLNQAPVLFASDDVQLFDLGCRRQ